MVRSLSMSSAYLKSVATFRRQISGQRRSSQSTLRHFQGRTCWIRLSHQLWRPHYNRNNWWRYASCFVSSFKLSSVVPVWWCQKLWSNFQATATTQMSTPSVLPLLTLPKIAIPIFTIFVWRFYFWLYRTIPHLLLSNNPSKSFQSDITLFPQIFHTSK